MRKPANFEVYGPEVRTHADHYPTALHDTPASFAGL
jgi:hypothetical protein